MSADGPRLPAERIRAAADAAEAADGITLRGVVTCIRHFGPERSRPIRRMRRRNGRRLATGLRAMAGGWAGKPFDFDGPSTAARRGGAAGSRCNARRNGAVHSPSRDALDALVPERIGPWRAAIDDPGGGRPAGRGTGIVAGNFAAPARNVVSGRLSRLAQPSVDKPARPWRGKWTVSPRRSAVLRNHLTSEYRGPRPHPRLGYGEVFAEGQPTAWTRVLPMRPEKRDRQEAGEGHMPQT